MAKSINNFTDLCNFFSADEPAGLNRRIYKDTDCGASISVRVQNPKSLAVPGDYLDLILKVRENAYGPTQGEDQSEEEFQKLRSQFRGLYVLGLQTGTGDVLFSRGPQNYFGDTLRQCYENAFWFEEFTELIDLGKTHFVCCSAEPLSFWPLLPRYPTEDWTPVTLETLKLRADAFRSEVNPGGPGWAAFTDHYLTFRIRKPRNVAREVTVTGRVIREPNGIAHLLELKYEPKGAWRQPGVFRDDFEQEPWIKGVMEFFDVGTDTPFKQIKDQKWEPRDAVTVSAKKDDLRITKTFKAEDRCYGWKVYPERDEVWVHNGSQLWRDITMKTPLLGFTIQSIVEGSDATVDSSEFVVPVKPKEVDDWIKEMEAETSRIWKAANTYLYEVVTKKKLTNFYVRLNWGDVEWEDEVPPKALKAKVEKLLKEYDGDFREDITGQGFYLRYLEESESMY